MLSIIIPCHNEAAVLPHVQTRLAALAESWGLDYEVLLVDDGSTDGTWNLIQAMQRRDGRWKGLRLARNFGQQAALGAGLKQARGEAIVCLDADLQDPPELIADFLEQWRAGADVVFGIRAERPEGLLKRLCYGGFYWLLQRLAQVPLPRDAGDFALMDQKVVRALNACREQRPFWRGLRAYVGFTQVGIPYSRHSRQAGQPQYTLRKLLGLASDGFWALTNVPARLLIGSAALATLLVAAFVVFGMSSSPWLLPSLNVMGLWCLAILGCGQARLYDEVRRRPRWVIAEKVGLGPRQRRSRKRTLAQAS